MKKLLSFFCLCFLITGCTSIENAKFFSRNSSLLAQRVQNSTLSEKEREFFLSALIFRAPQNLYGKTVKQIIEEERNIDEQSKQAEKLFTSFEHNFQISFPDGWKIPLDKMHKNSLFERFVVLKGDSNRNSICRIFLVADTVNNLPNDMKFSALTPQEQENLVAGKIKQISTTNPDANIMSSGFVNLDKTDVLLLTYKEHPEKEEKVFKAHMLHNEKLFTFTTITTDKTDRHLAQFIDILKSFKPIYSVEEYHEQTY